MKEIYKRIEDKVNTVKNLLNFSFDDSLIILHYFSWNIEKIENEYFNDPEKYEKLSGLKSLNEKDSPKILNNRCSICLISNPNISNGLQCNHSLCSNCWRNYFISMVIKIIHLYYKI